MFKLWKYKLKRTRYEVRQTAKSELKMEEWTVKNGRENEPEVFNKFRINLICLVRMGKYLPSGFSAQTSLLCRLGYATTSGKYFPVRMILQ